MRKLPLLLTLLLSCFIHAAAQDKTLAQLKKELEEHPQEDAARVEKLINLATNVFSTGRGKIYEEIFSISKKIDYKRGQSYALGGLGGVAFFDGNIQKADSLYKIAKSIAEEIDDQQLIPLTEMRIGIMKANLGDKAGMDILYNLEKTLEASKNYKLLARCQVNIASISQVNYSNYPVGMEYMIKARESAEKANSSDEMYTVTNNLSNLYGLLGDYDNALIYMNKTIETAKKGGGDIGKLGILNNLGEIYRLTGKYPEALATYKEHLAADSSLGTADLLESNIADVYVRMNNLPLAFQYAYSAMAKATQINDEYILAWVHAVLARAYQKKNIPDSSIYHANRGYKFAVKIGSIELMRDNREALANAYASKNDFANAYKYHREYIHYRDSMLGAEVKNRTAVLQHNSEMEKKQGQIAQLSQKQKAQQGFLISALVVLVLILITAGLLFRNNRQKYKANKLLHKQKQEIDQKAKDLERSYNNVELLGEIGRKITSSLSVETIISTVYDNVNSLMDASVFGIGIYHEDTKQIDFPATYENGMALPAYSNSIYEQNRFASLCFISGKEIVMGDLETEYKNYLQQVPVPKEGKQPASLIYLPLKVKDKFFGVITIQSFQKNAYSEYHLYMLRTIAIYAAIALENAESYKKLNQTVDSLKKTQTQLIQSEKMASLGELTAGIAHEIQNPLNFVNNFSEVNVELIDEIKEHLAAGDLQLAKETFEDIKQNLEKVRLHGKRADSIVKGMLQHSQTSTGVKQATDINALTDEYLRLAYHGLRAKDKSFNAITKTEFDNSIENINIVPQEIGRVLLNLINNAYYTVAEKKRQKQDGYEPTVTVTTVKDKGKIKIKVRDNGNGIPQKIMEKIFQPFFTTKPTGQGTGLGLSLAYDIVTKGHEGELIVQTKEGEGSEFIIELPDRLN